MLVTRTDLEAGFIEMRLDSITVGASLDSLPIEIFGCGD